MSIDIELYPRDQTDFTHHGYALDDISNDVVTWQLNSKFTLTFDYPMFSDHASDLVAENIVRVPVPGGQAAFRIAQVIKSMGRLSVTAYHVFWDLNDNFIADTNIVDKDGQGALDQIMRTANYDTGFKVQSTIGNVTNARLVRMSVISALLGTDDNTFINRWGGEFDWQDFSFSVNPRLGKDRGVHFEYAHNLTGYEATKDSSGITTRLLPEGYNGLLLPELYVDSPKISAYRKPKIGTKTYQDIKAIDETQATGDQDGAVPINDAYKLLRAAAAKEFSDNHIDEAQWTYKLNVALLENTEEYRNLAITTTVMPGDTVTITHKLDGIDVQARLTGYTWQPSNRSYLTQTYDSDSRPDVAYSSLGSQINEIKSQVQLVDKIVIAKAANGLNSIGWSDQSPIDLNQPGKTGDVFFQHTAEGDTMWIYHDGAWHAETGDAFGQKVQKQVDAALADAIAAQDKANAAVDKANANADLASMSNQTAKAASDAADAAKSLASESNSSVINLRATVDGLASTVANNHGQVTTVLQTLQGFQNTATNQISGLQSQQTQLSDQITSVVGGIGQRNLIYNSEFLNNAEGWGGIDGQHFYVATDTWAQGPDRGLGINTINNGVGGWAYADSKRVPVDNGATYSVSVDIINAEAAEKDVGIVLQFFPDESSGRISYVTAWANPKSLNRTETLKIEGQVPPVGAKFVNVTFVASGKACSRWQRPMLVASKTVGPYQPDTLGSSQITQLQDAINLRVTKDQVINQINISPEGILIDGRKVHITGQTSIDNAAIKSAAIADLSANKITTGTLNAALLNVINLNASSIVTGTISGANLAINLNTGMVEFQHGRIHSYSNNIDINIDQGYVSVANYDTRLLLKGGEMQFVEPQIFDQENTPYLKISNGIAGSSFWGGAFVGRDYAVITNSSNSGNIFSAPIGVETFSGLSTGKSNNSWEPTKIGGAERGVVISGGAYVDSDFMGSSPYIFVGQKSPTEVTGNGDRIFLTANWVHIRSAYFHTTSASPNLVITDDGTFTRSTSASKYKIDIKRDHSTDLAKRLLTLPTAHWLDKAAMERYAAGEQQELPQTNFGLIAEDLEAAGLEDLVVRGPDGELEGIQYDRIAAALLPLLSEMKTEIDELKATA